jgi:hypothetical protein
MDTRLINHATQPHELSALDKTIIAKTWQQHYEDRGCGLWGFSPSPAAKILSYAE